MYEFVLLNTYTFPLDLQDSLSRHKSLSLVILILFMYLMYKDSQFLSNSTNESYTSQFLLLMHNQNFFLLIHYFLLVFIGFHFLTLKFSISLETIWVYDTVQESNFSCHNTYQSFPNYLTNNLSLLIRKCHFYHITNVYICLDWFMDPLCHRVCILLHGCQAVSIRVSITILSSSSFIYL